MQDVTNAFGDVGQSFVCPLTLQLPLEPVTAQDGRIYDRKAMETYIAGFKGPFAISPMTRQTMGKQLTQARHVRDLFLNFILKGIWKDELAQTWLAEYKKKEATLKNIQEGAEKGDAMKMIELGHVYQQGLYGMTKDQDKAFQCYKSAADLKHATASVTASALVGLFFVKGWGKVKVDNKLGKRYLHTACGLGSEIGCFVIGRGYEEGIYGYRKNRKMACNYFVKMACSPNHDATSAQRKYAEDYVKQHLDAIHTPF
tara:strand:+ start:300 stop:1070 length:771 start_codon:yes stop_codon:yes gene_type:complete